MFYKKKKKICFCFKIFQPVFMFFEVFGIYVKAKQCNNQVICESIIVSTCVFRTLPNIHAVNYFQKKAPSQMFDRVLNTPMAKL